MMQWFGPRHVHALERGPVQTRAKAGVTRCSLSTRPRLRYLLKKNEQTFSSPGTQSWWRHQRHAAVIALKGGIQSGQLKTNARRTVFILFYFFCRKTKNNNLFFFFFFGLTLELSIIYMSVLNTDTTERLFFFYLNKM